MFGIQRHRVFALLLPCTLSKPELFCHFPTMDLRWGLSPEILTRRARSLPCLYMKEFSISNEGKLKPRTPRAELSPGSTEVSSCIEPLGVLFPMSEVFLLMSRVSPVLAGTAAGTCWSSRQETQTWPGALGFVAMGEVRGPANQGWLAWRNCWFPRRSEALGEHWAIVLEWVFSLRHQVSHTAVSAVFCPCISCR